MHFCQPGRNTPIRRQDCVIHYKIELSTKTWQAYKDKSDFLVLCLRIARAAEKLEVLPWETLYDGTEFIAARARASLVRLPLDILPQKDPPGLDWPFRMITQSFHQFGIIHYIQRDYTSALNYFKKSLEIKDEIGDQEGMARSLHQTDSIYHIREEYPQAL